LIQGGAVKIDGKKIGEVSFPLKSQKVKSCLSRLENANLLGFYLKKKNNHLG